MTQIKAVHLFCDSGISKDCSFEYVGNVNLSAAVVRKIAQSFGWRYQKSNGVSVVVGYIDVCPHCATTLAGEPPSAEVDADIANSQEAQA